MRAGGLSGSMERRVVVSASAAHAMTHTLELAFAALLVRIGLEFGVGVAALGAAATAGTVTFGATALPSGWLVDRFGPRAVMAWSMLSAGVLAFLVAAAPNMLVLVLALTLLGAGIGLYHPAGTSMVATVASRRGLALAAHGIAGNVGVAVAPAAAVGMALLLDWRAAYVVFGLAAFGVGMLVLRVAPSRDEAAAAVSERVLADAGRERPHRRSAPPAERRWLMPSLLLIYLSTIGQGFIYRGSLTFLTLHLAQHLGIRVLGWDAEAVAGGAATLVLLAAIGGQLAGGALSDRIPVERSLLPFVLLTGPFLAVMGFASGVLLLVAAAAFVFVNFAQQPVFNGLIADYAPAGTAGRAFGIMFFLTFGLGSFSATFAGLLAERWGTAAVFYALAGVSAAVFVAMSAVAAGAERRRARIEAPASEAERRIEAAAGG
jgi:MFS family permease